MQTNKRISKNSNNKVLQSISVTNTKYSKLFLLSAMSALILSAVFLLLIGQKDVVKQTAEMPVLSGDAAIAHLKQDNSHQTLAEAFASAVYKVEGDAEKAAASNSANDLLMSFDGKGLALKSANKENSWTSNWSLSSLGYGENQTKVKKGDLHFENNRTELKRDEQKLTEWFINKPEGVEHGFTLSERPTAKAVNQPLRLVMKVDGDLLAQAGNEGQMLTLSDNRGNLILNYEKLKVWDADGRDLSARMRTDGNNGEVWLEVQDKSAVYPLTIDPTFTQQQKLIVSDAAAGDFFGRQVAISGNTAIIGARGADINTNTNQGAAYIFIKAGTQWTQQQKLVASDGAVDDLFGSGVAISGNTVVVGAGLDDNGEKADQGSAYIFVRNGTTWTEQQKLIAADGEANDRLGLDGSVGISGDTVVVGAVGDDIDDDDNQGSAYIFTRGGTTWTQQQKLTIDDGGQGDFFGENVGIDGNTVIIGASGDDIGTEFAQGSAYIFTRSGTTWTLQQQLNASDGSGADYFGFSVAISGNTVIIGAYFDMVGNNDSQGSAYIFTRSGVTWTEQQRLVAADGEEGDRFGGDVSISGNTVVVGAYRDDMPDDNDEDTDVETAQGSAYTFTRSGTTWTQGQKLIASDGDAFDEFGLGVSISGGAIIVGAAFDDVEASTEQGAAYIFNSETTLTATPGRVMIGGTITVNYTIPAGQSATDRIGLFAVGSANTAILDVQNVPAGTSGSLTFTAPGTAGQYEFRYLLNGGTTVAAVSNAVAVTTTASQNPDTIGVFRPTNGITYLRNSNTGGFSDISFIYGNSGDKSITGDWDNDGKDTLGIFRNGLFYLRNTNSTGPADIVFAFGDPTDQPIAGDWDGDGTDTIGVYRQSTGVFFIRNSNSAGAPDAIFVLGNPNDIAITGDWNGDGIDTTGVFRPSNGIVFLKNTNTTGDADIAFVYGNAGDKPVAGDWNGDGIDSVGIYRGGIYYLRNSNTQGIADLVFAFGNAGDDPIVGDWDGLP